ncbi:MAG: SusE domain-containing protein [Bacteroidales bacterium]|nr:SusE domain-containing protein [Bacteroidales bacterium]
MKKIITILSAMLAVATACQKHYELNTDFAMPTSLSSPSSVTLDVTSSSTVQLAWTGGGAADGGIVLYEVLFDKAGGNFSEPLTVMPSDLGAGQTLTLTHATLNTIARKAGVAPNQTGSFIWTVRGSKGGVSKTYDGYETLSVTRGEGIDNMPERLFVAGSAAKEAGQEFRVVEEGLYSIVTRLGAGSLRFTSEKGGGLVFHASEAGKLVEGEGDYSVAEAPATGLARITVNFNTLSLKIESVEAQLHAAWEATGVDFAVLEYEGDGVFSGEGEAVFYGPGRDGTPSWCSWVEERYSFFVEIDGVQKRWGSGFGGNSFTPDGTDSFYYIYEFDKVDWDALWKMDHALDLKNVRVTVWTNKDNQFTHMVEEAGPIVYDQPTAAPAELFLTGAAAEVDGQAFRKDGDKFVAYAKLNAGALSFVDGDGVKYFIQNENDLYIGKRSYDVTASEGVTRITVDFSTNKVTFDEIGTDVRMIWGCNYDTVIALSYQGGGKFAGEGRVVFVDASRPESNPPSWLGWTEERYYFIATVNGTEVCWGRLDGEDAENRPDGEVSETFYDIGEFEWSQWDHLWKMGSVFDNSNVSAVIDTNDEGHFRHSFTKQSEDPFPPTVAPSELTLSGTGAEVEGQAFRKVADGEFVIFARLQEGTLSFQGDGKNYFFDAEKGLLQGDGAGTAAATAEGAVTKLSVNFKDLTVKAESIDKVRMIWGCCFGDIVPMTYEGAGVWGGSGKAEFVQPGDARCTWLTWVEERYYFVVTIDGEERLCWGRLDGVDGEYRPDDERFTAGENFYDCGEFGWSQWDHLWKMAGEMDGSDIEVKLYTNKDGVMTHTITKK